MPGSGRSWHDGGGTCQDRGEIGMLLQTITPPLEKGLGLAQGAGSLISDVLPGSAAATAGLNVQDIVVTIDGEVVDTVPQLTMRLFTRSAGDHVKLGVLRGSERLTVDVLVGHRPHDLDRLTEGVDPERSLVDKLGILGVDIDTDSAQEASNLRVPSGVMVVGHTKQDTDVDTGLTTGDTIHRINGTMVTSIGDLRSALDRLKPRSAVVLQIERNGQFSYLAFDLD